MITRTKTVIGLLRKGWTLRLSGSSAWKVESPCGRERKSVRTSTVEEVILDPEIVRTDDQKTRVGTTYEFESILDESGEAESGEADPLPLDPVSVLRTVRERLLYHQAEELLDAEEVDELLGTIDASLRLRDAGRLVIRTGATPEDGGEVLASLDMDSEKMNFPAPPAEEEGPSVGAVLAESLPQLADVFSHIGYAIATEPGRTNSVAQSIEIHAKAIDRLAEAIEGLKT